MQGLRVLRKEAYDQYAGDLARYAHVLVGPSAAADVVADTFADLLRNPDGAWHRISDYPDKLVQGAEVVPLEKRGAQKEKQFFGNRQAVEMVRLRMDNARRIKMFIENIIERPLDELF